jgi:uncharacterized protein YbjQ (UPF0145 family)
LTEPVPGIPQAARERLEEVRKSGGSFFTSDLTTNEFLLIRQAGFRPLTQVMGSCFYHVGWQGMPYMPGYQTQGPGWVQQGVFGGGSGYGQGFGPGMWRDGQTVELETTSEAWNEARRLALERLSEEARLAGADAVVGVRLQRGAYDWAAGLIEFVATGTAVASERFDLGEETVLSNLSGQEFAQLFRHGWWPVGLVAGTTVCYALTGWKQQQGMTFFGSRWQNQELTDFTRGLYDARTQAMIRLQRQAHELGSDGVVGVRIDQEHHEHEANDMTNLVITMHVLGTAIVEVRSDAEPPPVYVALPLNEEKR